LGLGKPAAAAPASAVPQATVSAQLLALLSGSSAAEGSSTAGGLELQVCGSCTRL
jgi:hypothetical protein